MERDPDCLLRSKSFPSSFKKGSGCSATMPAMHRRAYAGRDLQSCVGNEYELLQRSHLAKGRRLAAQAEVDSDDLAVTQISTCSTEAQRRAAVAPNCLWSGRFLWGQGTAAACCWGSPNRPRTMLRLCPHSPRIPSYTLEDQSDCAACWESLSLQ